MLKTKHKIAVIGAGNMGTALAQVIATKRNPVALWNFDNRVLRKIEETGKSPFLRGVELSEDIHPVDDINDAVRHAEVVIIAVASPYVRQMARLIAPTLKSKTIVVNVAKGMEVKSRKCMVDVIADELPEKFHQRITDISGPSLADEFAQGLPTAMVMASRDPDVFPILRRLFRGSNVRLVSSDDLYGICLVGVVKNVYAIALGLCEGLKMKANAKAWLTVMALEEMAKFIKARGGKDETVYGLAGLGDLIVTGFGAGRNRSYGVALAECKAGCKPSKSDSMTVEGIEACKAIMALAKADRLKLPLLETLYAIISRGRSPQKSMEEYFAHVRL